MKRLERSELLEEGGFSLTEVLVVSMLLGIILGAAYMAINTVTTVSDDIMARNEAQNLGQLAVEKMVREIRMVQQTSDGERFTRMDPKQVTFFADADHDGNLDRVTYTVADSKLTRSVAYSGKQNPDSSDFGIDTETMTLVNADSSVSTVFEYWDNGSETSMPAVTTNPSAVMAVKITLTADAESGAKSIAVNIPTTTVHIRADETGS